MSSFPAAAFTTPEHPSARRWDLLVIGGGTAGIVAAKTAAGFGSRVLLAERARTGGDCLWTGCVPSKALIAAGAAAATARSAQRLGVHVDGLRVDFTDVMSHVRTSVTTIAPVDSPQALREAGVTVGSGTAIFTGPDSAELEGVPVRFAQALVATGASPARPAIPGLAGVDALTSDSIWELRSLPERLLVLGGGSIGCELAQALARLGSRVTLVEAAERILPREDPDAAELTRRSMEADGVKILLGSPVSALEPAVIGSGDGIVHLADGRHERFDRVLLALGRLPRTGGLGLSAAGVELDANGFVQVDRHLRTTNRRIWAAGDVTAHPQFTHTAGVNASLAAGNAVLGLRRTVDTTAVPRVTFTHPEIAAVGTPTGPNLPSDLRLITWHHEHVDRAVTDADSHGFTRLVMNRKGRIVGATVVGPRAGESLAELALAVRRRMRPRDLAGTTHAYPTYSDGVWNAAIAEVRRALQAPGTAQGITALAAVRRLWLAVRPR